MTRLREVTGFALLILGLLGMLLPLLPGVPLVLAGVAILGSKHPRIQPWIERIERWRSSLRRKKTGAAQHSVGADPVALDRTGPLMARGRDISQISDVRRP